MARVPVRRARGNAPTIADPPWVDDVRPSDDPPPPIEPDWARAVRPSDGVASEPFEPDWAQDRPEDRRAPRPIDPPWAAESATDREDTLRAALAETAPPDPPWARAAPRPRQTKPIDPPWVEDNRPTNDPLPPIEPGWAAATADTNDEARQPADPPWANAAPVRPPVILRGPIDPPWVPDAISEALDAKEEAARAAFEPAWAANPAFRVRRGPLAPVEPSWAVAGAAPGPEPTGLFDPGWERSPSLASLRPPPIEPDWASEGSEARDDQAIELFDPDWEEAGSLGTVETLPPMEPSWAVETRSEVEQARSDPFDSPYEENTISLPDKTIVRRGARRLKDLASQVSLNPFGRAKRKSEARALDRQKLIAEAMRIRSETREALGEDTVNALYRGIMGTDPPAGENR